MALIASTEVAPDFRAPGWARTWCHERLAVALQGRGGVDAQLLEDVSMVVSELVTNAVRTGCAELTVQLFVEDDRIRLAVIDDGGGLPVQQHPRVDATHGRGLAIVGALSRDWGVRPLDTGKEVWADLALTPPDHSDVSSR